MILLQINTVCLVLAASSTLAEYSTHESEEEDDSHYRDQPPVDYTQYFNGMGRTADTSATTQPANQSTGFVQPLDFADFFQSSQFGLSRGVSPQVFQSPGAALPLSLGGFPVQERNSTVDNPAGFVDDMQFRSIFDTSGSASEHDFNRPQEFSSRHVNPGSSYRGGFVAPAFGSLQQDVDREVDYQRRQEDAVEKSRATRREPSEAEDEEDDDIEDFDSSELEDFPASHSGERSQNKYTNDGSSRGLPGIGSRKPVNPTFKPAFSSVHSSSNPRLVESNHRKPYTSYERPEVGHDPTSKQVYDEDEASDYGVYSKSRPQSSENNHPDTQRKHIPIKTFYHSLPIKEKNPPSKNNDPYYLNHPRSQPNYPGYTSGLSYPVVKPTSYNSPKGAQYRTASPYYTKSPSNFRPSPRDTYLDSLRNSPQRRTLYYSSPKPVKELRSQPIPHTDYSTAIPRRAQHPATKSSCKKIKKKMDDEELSRFKRQQMTCYICTNKEKGNTYEECSYESEPLGKSFYKGSAETYSTETVLPETKHHSRARRSSNKYFESVFTLSKNEGKPLVRRIRQYHYAYDPDEQGHGPENYRFSPDYVQAKNAYPSVEPKPKEKQSLERYVPQNSRPPSRRRQNNKNESSEKPTGRHRTPVRSAYAPEKRNRPQSRDQYRNYEHDEDDYDDDTDIEKEYQPPGASDDDDCKRVDKDGLVCMVCQNPKSGGTYEQCSYASDPDANRYEYSRQKTYGNPRNPEADRYKRYTVKSDSKRGTKGDEVDDSPNTNSRYSNNERNHDFKNGKLKRKKVRPNDNSKRPTTYPKSKRRKSKVSKEKDMPGVVGLDPYFYGSSGKAYDPNDYDLRGRQVKGRQRNDPDDDKSDAVSAEDDSEEDNPTYEESFFKLFPELIGQNPYTGESIERRGKKDRNDNTQEDVKEDDDEFSHPEVPDDGAEDEEESESKQSSNKVKLGFNYGIDMPTLYFDEDESKKDLEKALDEFKQKNRSDCKKVIKDKMTCYQCLDKNNMQHEECMFVAATEPKSKHLAYHEVKQFRMAPGNNVTENSTVVDLTVPASKNSSEQTSKSLMDHRHGLKYPNIPHNPAANVLTRRKFSPGVKALSGPPTQKQLNTKRFIKPRDHLKVNPNSHSGSKDRILGEESQVIPSEAAMIMSIDSGGQPALVFDILKVNPKNSKMSTHNTTNAQNSLQRIKRKPSEEDASSSERKRKVHEETNNDENHAARNNSNQRSENNEEQDEEESPNTRPRYNSVPEDPEEFQIREGPEGAYSHETRPVFDPVLKISLPRYMLTRSEHERVFDEVLRSG